MRSHNATQLHYAKWLCAERIIFNIWWSWHYTHYQRWFSPLCQCGNVRAISIARFSFIAVCYLCNRVVAPLFWGLCSWKMPSTNANRAEMWEKVNTHAHLLSISASVDNELNSHLALNNRFEHWLNISVDLKIKNRFIRRLLFFFREISMKCESDCRRSLFSVSILFFLLQLSRICMLLNSHGEWAITIRRLCRFLVSLLIAIAFAPQCVPLKINQFQQSIARYTCPHSLRLPSIKLILTTNQHGTLTQMRHGGNKRQNQFRLVWPSRH